MLQRAQSLVDQLRAQVRTTLGVVVDLAQALGLPAAVTALLTREPSEPGAPFVVPSAPPPAGPPPRGTSTAAAPSAAAPSASRDVASAPSAASGIASGIDGVRAASRRPSRKVALEGDRGRSSQVRMLHAEDAINGSTYLARIIWSLGVARLEGLGPLRPADMARIIMARAPVSLEPPNVARYIRRSHPPSIAVDHSEGSSHFYKLTAEGQRLFEASFGAS